MSYIIYEDVKYTPIKLYIGNSLKSREKWEKSYRLHSQTDSKRPPICLKKGGYTIILTHGSTDGRVKGWDGISLVSLNDLLKRRNINGKVIIGCCYGSAVERLYLKNGGDPKKVIFLNQTNEIAVSTAKSFKKGYITFIGVIPTPKLFKQLKGTPLKIDFI